MRVQCESKSIFHTFTDGQGLLQSNLHFARHWYCFKRELETSNDNLIKKNGKTGKTTKE